MTDIRAQIHTAIAELMEDDPHPTPEAIDNAVALVDRLSQGFSQPEVAMEPDGGISLDWCSLAGIFSVSVGEHLNLPYAMNLDGKSEHGVYGADDILLRLEAHRDVLGAAIAEDLT